VRKRINLIVIFYVLYFTWLFLLAYLWPDTKTLTYFLLSVIVFYFLFLREHTDIIIFVIVAFASFFITKTLAYDPGFADVGFPELGVPYWPLAWGITTLAVRKFYLIISKNPQG